MAGMLDIVFGSAGQSVPETNLRQAIQALLPNGTLYFSYPIFEDVEGLTNADALLVTDEHGLIVFDLSTKSYLDEDFDSWINEVAQKQDDIFRNIHGILFRNRDLVQKRKLVIEPAIITVLPEYPQEKFDSDICITTPDRLHEILKNLSPISEVHKLALNASIQRISTIKPRKKRDNIKSDSSYGFTLSNIEKKIANLDAWQKKSAIAYPEGPQRIRGLAGSGKTIVLALKAAYLHAIHPEWNIVVTYYSRSLRQQFRDLIRRFLFETRRDEPDWTKIQVMHSWGSRSEPGVYSEVASNCGLPVSSWRSAHSRYGNRSFDGICNEVLEELEGKELSAPLYDAVLIDEAQDFPTSFFKMVYAATTTPKRIVWAYDELQNLGDYSMPSPEELFGKNFLGEPNVTLRNEPERPPQDIILRVCYRNTPWALTVAHGLGFGIYRSIPEKDTTPIVQMFDDPNLWQEIGYECIKGNLALGSSVHLKRRPDCTPAYYRDENTRLIEPKESIVFASFGSAKEQAQWIAKEIQSNIIEDELVHSDIMVVLPDAWTAKSEFAILSNALSKLKIPSHLVGTSSSRDEVFEEGSIAVTHIFRAKGNEAPMVYVANAHECYEGLELAKKRNTLFTAITRSRAWVRVCGVGPKSEQLNREFSKLTQSNFVLKFRYPSVEEIGQIRRIHRDRSEKETRQISEGISQFSDVVDLIRKGEVPIEALPSELIDQLRDILRRD